MEVAAAAAEVAAAAAAGAQVGAAELPEELLAELAAREEAAQAAEARGGAAGVRRRRRLGPAERRRLRRGERGEGGASEGGTEVRVRPEVRVVEAEAGPGTRLLPGREAPSERAQDFARRQMYGGGVRRAPAGRGISNHMVVQPRELAKRGPASNFVKS